MLKIIDKYNTAHTDNPRTDEIARRISGYKININKTQVLTFNYDPRLQLKLGTTGIDMTPTLSPCASRANPDKQTVIMAEVMELNALPEKFWGHFCLINQC